MLHSLVLVVLAVVGCADGTRDRTPDYPDVGPRVDAGMRDSGNRDAGGMTDASEDAPGTDAGRPVDAGPPDSGPPDAGPPCAPGRIMCGGMCVLSTDVRNCGMCGNDCTMLPGVDPTRVRCFGGDCQVLGACTAGFGDCDADATTGCETSLTTDTHCGNCVVACGGGTPFCSADTMGVYRCGTGCSGSTPDRCSSGCTDLRDDPMNCGTCDRVCTTSMPFAAPTCVAGVCGVTCAPGYHDCSGTCVSATDPATCGTRCTPCPVPMGGMATCTGGACGITCDPGLTACSGECVDIMTSRPHCGGCGRVCMGACVGGLCDTGVRITLESGGGQTAYIDQLLPLPVIFRVHDVTMTPVPGASVTLTAPPGAVITPTSGITDSMGRIAATVRLGRAATMYRFSATTPMGLMPATADATATNPPSGTLFPIANAAHTAGSTGTPGPATAAQMGAVRGLAVAADGTVYVADYTYHVVRAISPVGEMTILAGRSGSLGSTGDGGPAAMALLRNPSGLALDATARLLYIADTGNNRIRVVDLASGNINAFAGGGTAAAPTYGDGGSATAANLLSPGHVRIGPDGAVYISDVGHNRIRRVDRGTGIISLYIEGGATLCTGQRVQLSGCQSEPRSCDIVWDSGGRAFVSGYWCGSDVGTTTYGIARRATDGTLTYVAGQAGGVTSDGSAARASLINGAGSLALDPGGNLYVVEYSSHRIRKIDGVTGAMTTVVGTGTAGYGMDHVPAAGQPLNTPWDIAFDSSRNLHLTEVTNATVRTIWDLGVTTAGMSSLAVFSGAMQTALVDAQVSTAFAVRLTDGAGMPLVGFPIQFAPIDEGAGVVASTANTTLAGVAATFGRPGLLPASYRVEARFDDLHGMPVMGSPVTFTVMATAPAEGTIFTAVNVDRAAGRVPGPATYGRVGGIGGMVVAADGFIYLADRTQHVIWRLSPRGALSLYAGTGTAGSGGDGGAALSAQLNAPHGLAIDPMAQVMYVADRTNDRVRAIDMRTNIIRTVAGGGTATLSPYGDGGPATTATLADPGSVSVDAMGLIYVSDTGRNRIRVVDPTLGLISAWEGGNTGACSTSPVVLYGCGSSPNSCHVVFDATGNAYISGQLCGNAAPLSTIAAYGIVRRAPDGTLTHIAGQRLGSTAESVMAPMAGIGGAGHLAFDSSGALHYTDFGQHKVRVIDPMTSRVTTVAGSGTAGFSGEYVAASTAVLNTPWGLLFTADHLFVADSGNNAVRVIW